MHGSNQTLLLSNPSTSEHRTVKVSADGGVGFDIANPVDYQLWRYEVE